MLTLLHDLRPGSTLSSLPYAFSRSKLQHRITPARSLWLKMTGFALRPTLFVLSLLILLDRAWADDRPNLLLFLADDLTFSDVACYGNPDVKTPFIDELASEGLRLTRCYNPAPACSPLRQSLYTGLYPVRNGAHPNHSRVYDHVRSLPHYLGALGYRTGIIGKRHEAPASAFPFEMLGGNHHDGGRSPAGEDLPLENARPFLTRDPEQPWCLLVASNQPHAPWNRGDTSAYDPDALTVPPYLVDTPELREGLSRYYAEITYMDAQVGHYTKRPAEELFDLQNDPWCLTNRAGDDAAAEIQEELSRQLDNWMKQQGDLGDATERSAEARQPEERPWARENGYSLAVP